MAGSPSPSPYAPGIIGDERTPPRPPTRPVVFLVATFVMTIVTSGPLWNEWTRRAMTIIGVGPSTLGLIYGLENVSGLLMLLWAFLSDAVPLWGTRREGYVMLTSLLTAAVWIAIAIGSRALATWLGAAVALGVLGSASHAAVVGALAEIGQRRASTGRLAAAYAGIGLIASFAARTLSVGSSFWEMSLPLTAGVVTGLCLAVIALAATLSDRAPPLPPAPAERVRLRAFFRSRAFWSSACVIACASVAVTPRALVTKMSEQLYGPDTAWWFSLVMPLLGIAVAGGYLLACRRVGLGVHLRAALFAKALTRLALASRDPSGLAFIGTSVADTFADVAFLDLAWRVAPRGREAFGAVVLFTLSRVLAGVAFTAQNVLETSAREAAAFGGFVAIVAVLAVSLLPAEIAGSKDGVVVGSRP